MRLNRFSCFLAIDILSFSQLFIHILSSFTCFKQESDGTNFLVKEMVVVAVLEVKGGNSFKCKGWIQSLTENSRSLELKGVQCF